MPVGISRTETSSKFLPSVLYFRVPRVVFHRRVDERALSALINARFKMQSHAGFSSSSRFLVVDAVTIVSSKNLAPGRSGGRTNQPGPRGTRPGRVWRTRAGNTIRSSSTRLECPSSLKGTEGNNLEYPLRSYGDVECIKMQRGRVKDARYDGRDMRLLSLLAFTVSTCVPDYFGSRQ